MAGYFYTLLKDEGFLRLLPGGLDARLRDVREIQAAKADRLRPEIHRLRQRFERAGLDVIFIKGPFLSKRFYGDPGFRYYGDIDLLVHGRGDVMRSAGVLREAGYVRRSIPLLGHGAAMRFVYHFVYRSDSTKIDLHWALRSHFSYKVDYDRVWASRGTERLDGQDFRVLSCEYVLLLLMLSILGDYQKARVRLKFLTDLYMVLHTMGDDTDWEDFFERRRHEGVLKISATVLDLTLDLLACREDFPQLASSLLRYGDSVKGGLIEPIDFLQWSGSNRDKWSGSNRDKLRNDIWTFRLHEGGMARSMGWRLLTEPFSRAAFR